MAYHVECYTKLTGKTPKGAPAKYSTKCDDPACDRMINAGDSITWTRRGSAVSTDSADEKTTATAPKGSMTALAAMLADDMRDLLGLTDLSALADEIASKVQTTVTIEIKRPEIQDPEKLGVQHRQFQRLLDMVIAGVNVYLPGPAGSGKTHASAAVARALGVKFHFTGAVKDEFGLLGFRTATGDTVRTPFREAFEHGGVFLFDEFDASDPNAIVSMNAALDNGVCAFPDGVIAKHPDFRLIAAANTFGLGATSEYVGRNRLDAATLNRFAFLSWDYDTDLETQISGNVTWAKRVQTIRARAREKGLKVLITPRATIMGAKLLAVGIPQSDVETSVIRGAMTDDQWSSIAA